MKILPESTKKKRNRNVTRCFVGVVVVADNAVKVTDVKLTPLTFFKLNYVKMEKPTGNYFSFFSEEEDKVFDTLMNHSFSSPEQHR